MGEQLQRLMYCCRALEQQMEDECEQLGRYLEGDIFRAYREEIQAEQELLERVIRRMQEL